MKNFIFKINRALAAKTKIFSILAAAIIALSFVSCEKDDPGAKFFRLKVTVTDSTTTISINPVDTTAFYVPIFAYTRDIEQYNLDTIIAEEIDYYQEKVDAGYALEECYGLFQGFLSETIPNGYLPANTSFTLAAFEIKEENGKVSCGHVATKKYTTKKIDVVETIDWAVLDTGLAVDYRDYMGFFILQGLNLDEEGYMDSGVSLCIYEDGDVLKGTYNFSDMHPEYSAILDETELYLADAKVTCNTKSDGSGKASGWVVAENGVKYKFSFKYTLEAPGAPARIGKKEFVKEENDNPLQRFSLLRFRK